MASINIYEQDFTQSAAYDVTETIVYIPGMPGQDCPDLSGLVNTPILFESVSDFTAKIGTKPGIAETIEDSEGVITVVDYDKSYVMAKQLLAMGMSVLYEVVANNENIEVPAASKTELVARLKNIAHWEKLEDRALYNIRFLTSGGYPALLSESDNSIALNMIDTAAFHNASKTGRGDCVALIDHVKGLKNYNEIFNIFQSALSSISDYGTYGSGFTPWCSHSLVDMGGVVSPDDAENGTWLLPGSFAYLGAYQTSLASNPTWYAAAGVTRGACPTLIKPEVEFGEKAAASLQTRAEGNIAINPICYITPYGYRVYGNRTLKPNLTNLKATSFLNIRNLISDIKKTSFAACRRMTFEQNTDVLWFNLRSQILPLLDKMKTGSGIKGYRLIKLDADEKAKLKFYIRIVPIEAVEDFDITIQLVDDLEFEVEG